MNDVLLVMDDDDQIIEDSLIVSPEALIQPWAALKRNIEYMLFSNINVQMKRIKSKVSAIDCEIEERPLYPLSIPYGFQLMETIEHPSVNANITSMLYMPSIRNQFAAMDGNHVHLWAETNHMLKFPIKKPRNDEKGSPVTAITQWEYAEKWRVIIISTSLLEIKTLTNDFTLTSVKSSMKPVLKYVD